MLVTNAPFQSNWKKDSGFEGFISLSISLSLPYLALAAFYFFIACLGEIL
jgi:hypothetical protein